MNKKAAFERLQEPSRAVRVLRGGLTVFNTIYPQGTVILEPDENLIALAQEGVLVEFVAPETGGEDDA